MARSTTRQGRLLRRGARLLEALLTIRPGEEHGIQIGFGFEVESEFLSVCDEVGGGSPTGCRISEPSTPIPIQVSVTKTRWRSVSMKDHSPLTFSVS